MKEKISILMFSLVAFYGVSYLFHMIIGTTYSNSPITVIVFGVCYLLIKQLIKNWKEECVQQNNKKRIIYSFILAYVFAITMIVGYQLRLFGMTDGGIKGKGFILIRGLCLAVACLPFSNLIFIMAERIKAVKTKENLGWWSAKKMFFVGWGAIFLCWMPVFLAYYPAIMGYDFHRQYQEALLGFIWFNGYQPLAHTWLIWLFLNIGKWLGSYQIGMACYSIFQMLLLSVACSYSVTLVYRFTKKKIFPLLCVLFYGIMPFFSVLSVSVTKDVIFTALFIVFICLFLERTFFAVGKKRLVFDILWLLEGTVLALFRNNAIYAIAIFMVFYVITVEKKQKIKILVLCVLLVVCGKLAMESMYVLIGTEIRGHKVEMYSVPIQQFARVGYYHGSALDEETYYQINTFVPADFWQRYKPHLSDPVKDYVGAYTYKGAWEGNIPKMLSTWAKVGLKYPNEYIDAFLLLTSGYWFIDDVSWAAPYEVGVEFKNGALTTRSSTVSDVLPEGIPNDSKFPWLENILDHIVCGNEFFQWPVVSNLFKTSTYCWLTVLALLISIYNREKKKILVVTLPLCYLFTSMLGPVVHVRYVLPIMMTVPVLLAMLLYKEREEPLRRE